MKGHIADKNLAAYRRLTTIAMRYDDLGNAIGTSDVEETNRCYVKAAEYRLEAHKLREDIPVNETEGRVLSGVEWRTLSEFPNYEMNVGGEVRRIETLRFLKPTFNNSKVVYSLRNDKGKTCRVVGKLHRMTFPEAF